MLTLHKYQDRGIEFSMDTKTTFEMVDLGLGKTAIVLNCLKRIPGKALIVAPLEVMYNVWPQEIKLWAPELSYTILHGPKKLQRLKSKRKVYIINYEGIMWFYKTLIKHKFKIPKLTLVLDESSWIKDPSTKRFKMLKTMSGILIGDYRFNMSGSPASKGLHNLWSQYYILDQGARLGKTYYSFRNKYFKYTGPPVYKTTPLLGAKKKIYDKIADITFRLDGKDHLDLPEMQYNNITMHMSGKLKDTYEEMEREFCLELSGNAIEAWTSVARDCKLKQMLQGAVYYAKGKYEEVHKHKLETLKYVVESLNGNPLLCPIQYRFEHKMICAHFKKHIPIVAGGVSRKERDKLFKQWNNGELPLLLCHPRSVAYGLNLQHSGYNILWHALTWSKDQYDQLNGRLGRQGQKSKFVVVNHTVFKDTVDEVVMKVLQENEKTQRDLLNALRNYAIKKGY